MENYMEKGMKIYKNLDIIGLENPKLVSKQNILVENITSSKETHSIKILYLAKEIKKSIGNQPVYLRLYTSDEGIEIENKKLHYVNEDIII
ncbi:hypothetical protein NL50_17160 [Clostridium acetobutylicum]|nr:hypothetical protein NL50_17160 [Clostridium acetobutylicum]